MQTYNILFEEQRFFSDTHYSVLVIYLLTFATFDCLAASNWPPGHPRSDHHVRNPHRPDYY